MYMKQHSSSTCIWSIYLSDDTIFQSLWFLVTNPVISRELGKEREVLTTSGTLSVVICDTDIP
jgi:hypothetical protein